MLYHKEIGFPSTLEVLNDYSLDVYYSIHAINASLNDRYGAIKLPDTISFKIEDIVEVETSTDIVVDKVVVRLNYSEEYDLVMVILLATNLVKTVWLNAVNDVHKTLNTSKYDKPRP